MVTYNYAKLLSSAGGNVKFLNEVGTVSAVKNGFEKQFFFSRSDRTVSRDNFTFTGTIFIKKFTNTLCNCLLDAYLNNRISSPTKMYRC